MQLKGRSYLLSLMAASMGLLSPAYASGFLMIDPVVGVRPAIGIAPPNFTPIFPHRPGPHPIVRPNPPLLKGSVSAGLHLKDQSVKVTVIDQVARTYIKQVFSNDTDQNLAGTYLFPLPDDTTFSSFSLHIDGKTVEGKILAADEARSQYEEIVRRLVDPGLLEYADYKTVRARIFPIPAHGTKTVELEYTQLLKAQDGLIKYHFPLKTEGEQLPSEEIKIDLSLSGKQPIRGIWSPSHHISVDRDGDKAAKVAFKENNALPDKDFVLYYNLSDKAMAANLLTNKNESEQGYFLLTITPPQIAQKTIAKDIVLVADTSGSMAGEKMDQSKGALKYVINSLNAEDHFNVVSFASDVDSFKSSLVQATPENKKAALKFVDELEARGGTNISAALNAASTLLGSNSARPAFLCLMTDGQPSEGETDIGKLVKNSVKRDNVRVFDFGVGYDVNTQLLSKLAESHHGTSQYVEPNESIETAVSAFYDKVKSPVLTDASIKIDGVETKNVYPKDVRDIFAGSQVMLMGRYNDTGKATVKLTGNVNGLKKEYLFNVAFPKSEPSNTYLPRLWAMRRIGYLSDLAKDNNNPKEEVDEIVELSKKYGIITAYTSFLVTDPNELNAHGRPVSALAAAPGAIGGMSGSAGNFGTLNNVRRGGGAVAPQGGARWYSAPNVFRMEQPNMPRQLAVDSLKKASRSSLQGATNGVMMQALPPSAGPLDARLSVGQQAVQMEKANNSLKDAFAVANEPTAAGAMIKSIEDKTFYLQNGVWTEGGLKDAEVKNAKKISFASAEYFDLLKKHPQLAKYLAVGQSVTLRFNGAILKIVPADQKTS
jgi:Ca-activated chloride channel family protein